MGADHIDRYRQCAQRKAARRIRTANDVDHIIPEAKGGTDMMDNLRTINATFRQVNTVKADSKY